MNSETKQQQNLTDNVAPPNNGPAANTNELAAAAAETPSTPLTDKVMELIR